MSKTFGFNVYFDAIKITKFYEGVEQINEMFNKNDYYLMFVFPSHHSDVARSYDFEIVTKIASDVYELLSIKDGMNREEAADIWKLFFIPENIRHLKPVSKKEFIVLSNFCCIDTAITTTFNGTIPCFMQNHYEVCLLKNLNIMDYNYKYTFHNTNEKQYMSLEYTIGYDNNINQMTLSQIFNLLNLVDDNDSRPLDFNSLYFKYPIKNGVPYNPNNIGKNYSIDNQRTFMPIFAGSDLASIPTPILWKIEKNV